MKRKQMRNRDGGAVVESALCLPLVLLIVSATIELSTTIYLKESLTIAAYEGARVAVTRKATDEDVINRITQVLEERHIDMGSFSIAAAISITPSADTALMMEPIEITVTAPTSGNTVSPFNFMQYITPPDMFASVVMRKEFTLESEEEEE